MLLHNRKRLRLLGFNYSRKRHYFFTIVVKDRFHSFGLIKNKSICLSANGIIAREQWHWLGRQYPYIDLNSFVIMPDHVHGIIFINSDYYINNCAGNSRDCSQHPLRVVKILTMTNIG